MLSPGSRWKSYKTDCCRCYGTCPGPYGERDLDGNSASVAGPLPCLSGALGPGHGEGQGPSIGGRGHASGSVGPAPAEGGRKLHLPGFPAVRLGRGAQRARTGGRKGRGRRAREGVGLAPREQRRETVAIWCEVRGRGQHEGRPWSLKSPLRLSLPSCRATRGRRGGSPRKSRDISRDGKIRGCQNSQGLEVGEGARLGSRARA